jgi:4'-phosphopantetheinyl transferase EntD
VSGDEPLIGAILPDCAVAVEAFDDATPAPLFPEEARLVANAVEKRRREFATARRCAREALAAIGHPPGPLPTGARGAPVWPGGVVGSITHCAGYRAAVVAPAARLWSVGIDAEPDEPLPDGVLAAVASEPERAAVDDLLRRDGRARWDRLLFCAKESVYKAWFPLTGRFLDFTGAVVSIDPAGGFTARLTVDGPVVGGDRVTAFRGRWSVARGLAVTAVALERSGGGGPAARQP